MANEELKISWAITLRYLAASRYYLSEQLPTKEAKECWAQAEEYMHHNELGLALEELITLGSLCEAPNEFWAELLSAAKNMERTQIVNEIMERRFGLKRT